MLTPDKSWPLAPLPWQQPQWQQLQQALLDDSFPPALLLAGNVGIGKQQFAAALTARLLCYAPVAGTACGDCKSCVLLRAGNHGDLLWLAPEAGKRVIKVDQVRAAIHFANQTPGLGARKVIALDPAEALNVNGSNALLKSLEEPSESTSIILVSHVAGALPATIRSRCQRLNLAQPAATEATAWLTTVCGDPALAAELLEASDNRPMLAAELYRSDGMDALRALREGLDGLLGARISPLEFPQLVADIELGEVIELFERRVGNEIRCQSTAGAGVGAGVGDLRPLFLLHEELQELRRLVANGANPNRQMTIENCALRLVNCLGESATQC
ncbi:DNA polymerase III subunit delta' [Halieaceae bacterium IMCC14734]|uniref:DNA-directed DNA polymerase n=1 Tax=Candidatus Litorirhabdus singularis TaxID=2518993 RepID=A0ABT3TGD8_9GAMM|nr:DNA polymerase III subunit delta' [Candidatus Litorirhabdus singularis]MCX2981371.1 DNA polymerase III subunit delta' [Candidatus Litorirhabdus singularis]